MSNSSFRMFSSAAKASIKPASMPVKTRSTYNMSSMLQEITDIEARYKGPANAANMTLDELWDDYYARYRRAGPVLMWEEPWMPKQECELLPYETITPEVSKPEAPKPEAPKAEFPKPREYYLQMVLYVPPETDEEKPEETEDKPANASKATPKPATRPRPTGIFDSIWAETPTSRSSQSRKPQTQKPTTSSSQSQTSSSPSSSTSKQSSSPFSGPSKQSKSTTSSLRPPNQASRRSDSGENHKNHRRRHNHKSASSQQHHHPQTQASSPRHSTSPSPHAHPAPHQLPKPNVKKGHGSINDSMWAS
ncbi:hypothetical protein KCU81_g1600, partial [Aureobasidium melanogenum]|uniref:Uncharacterized protein n=1 Tax=Aureobasidium melanogenum (strain CBS 110374) TaxID=1043003 RepID=A0A074W357_AURM1